MSSPLGPDSLARGERHEVCTNVVVCEPRNFIVPYACDVRSRRAVAKPRHTARKDALVFLAMSAFGFAALAMVLAFALMVERIAL